MGLLDTQIPNSTSDVVGVFDSDFQQVFFGARPIKVAVKETAKVMKHPIENGSTITDHKIIEPAELDLYVILQPGEYRSVYAQIKSLFRESVLLTVQTRATSYQNMIISGIPHDEEPSLFNTITMVLRLEEVQFVSAQFDVLPADQVENPVDASTVDRGEQQTTESTEEVPSSWAWRRF